MTDQASHQCADPQKPAGRSTPGGDREHSIAGGHAIGLLVGGRPTTRLIVIQQYPRQVLVDQGRRAGPDRPKGPGAAVPSPHYERVGMNWALPMGMQRHVSNDIDRSTVVLGERLADDLPARDCMHQRATAESLDRDVFRWARAARRQRERGDEREGGAWPSELPQDAQESGVSTREPDVSRMGWAATRAAVRETRLNEAIRDPLHQNGPAGVCQDARDCSPSALVARLRRLDRKRHEPKLPEEHVTGVEILINMVRQLSLGGRRPANPVALIVGVIDGQSENGSHPDGGDPVAVTHNVGQSEQALVGGAESRDSMHAGRTRERVWPQVGAGGTTDDDGHEMLRNRDRAECYKGRNKFYVATTAVVLKGAGVDRGKPRNILYAEGRDPSFVRGPSEPLGDAVQQVDCRVAAPIGDKTVRERQPLLVVLKDVPPFHH